MNHLSTPLTRGGRLSLSPPLSHNKDSRRVLPEPNGNEAAAPA